MERILITGCSGAGKTTLARGLSRKFNLPLIHLDQHFWQPNWEKPNMDEWYKKVEKMALEEKWIMEGNYASTFEVRFRRATMLIHFDIPRLLCLYRCIKRRMLTGRKVRSDMAEGCIERFELNFYKYIWSYPLEHNPIVYEAREKYFNGDFVILKSPSDVVAFQSS